MYYYCDYKHNNYVRNENHWSMYCPLQLTWNFSRKYRQLSWKRFVSLPPCLSCSSARSLPLSLSLPPFLHHYLVHDHLSVSESISQSINRSITQLINRQISCLFSTTNCIKYYQYQLLKKYIIVFIFFIYIQFVGNYSDVFSYNV